MDKQTRVKYKHAYNAEKRIVYVQDLSNTPEVRKDKFTCISCGNILIPKLGEVKQKHFAHKQAINCSRETYLHKLAKELFFQEYQSCLQEKKPFWIELEVDSYCDKHCKEFGITCQLGSEFKRYDLTKRYCKIFLETREGKFIPDLLLLDNKEHKKLFVEIAVTHKSSKEKVGSEFNIIEFEIEKEEDIFFLKNHLVREDLRTKFLNFNIQPIRGTCKGRKQCPEMVGLFRVFRNGKSIYRGETLPFVSNFLRIVNKSIIYHEVFNPLEWWDSQKYIAKVIELYAKGINIKNCYLCKYQGDNFSWRDSGKPIFCKFLKIKCNSNQAANCQYFRT
jgi:hypothetical protein